MNFLVTAGSTQSPIDRVRCLTNIFTGRTGTAIARTAWGRGHTVTLLTSRPDALLEFGINYRDPGDRLAVVPFRTFDELASLLQAELRDGRHDALCHAAAVTDFLPAGTFAPDPGTFFNARNGHWEARGGPPTLTERRGGKLQTAEPELWVRLVRAPKLIDRVRQPWGFGGVLVKFQVEAGLAEAELLEVAEAARRQSAADLIAASTLDAAPHWAILGPVAGRYERVPRRELPDRLVLAVEDLFQERTAHG
jgi:phosphopantothenoylcysteine synthetase/decarboxylase